MADRRILAALAFLIPLSVYIGFQRYRGSGDTVPAELLPLSILREGSLDFNEFVQPGSDLPYYFIPVGHHVVSAYPIVPGLMNLPVHVVARALGIDLVKNRKSLCLISAALIAAGACAFLFVALRRICKSEKTAFGFTLLFGLGTCAWTDGGINLFQHGTSLLFLCAAIWALETGPPSRAAWAGFFLGMAVWNRPTNIVFALALSLLVWRHHRGDFAKFGMLAAIPAVLMAWYSLAYWGSLRALGQAQGASGFTGSPLRGLPGLLFCPGRGLFVFTPVFLFALGAIPALRRETHDPLPSYLAVSVTLLVGFYSFWAVWWGGHCYGYRLITEASAPLIVLVAFGWRWRPPGGVAPILFVVLAAISIVVQVVGVLDYPSGFDYHIDEEPQRLWHFPDTEIVYCFEKFAFRRGLLRHAPIVPQPLERESSAPKPYPPWWTPANNDDSIPGWYDSPQADSTVVGALLVDGWAKSASGDVEVRIILDNGAIVSIPDRMTRPDVARAIPRLDDTSRAGFRKWFLPPPGSAANHTLTIEFRSREGHVRRIGPIHFTWKAR